MVAQPHPLIDRGFLFEPWKNNFFVQDYRPEMDAVTGVFSTCKPVSWNGMPLKEMDAFQQILFNSQHWSLFFVETWCPQNQCLSCQRCCQHWTFFVWHNAPKMDAFMKDGLNVKPVLLKQKKSSKWMPFRKGFLTLFNSQRKTYFLLKPDAPKTNAFHVKDVVNIEPFLFDITPPKWMPLWKMFPMWSQFF